MSDEIAVASPLGWIPLDQIALNEYNPNQMSDTDFQGLVANIRKYGFRGGHVLVRPNPDPGGKPWIMVDGEHRWRAMAEINKNPPAWMTEEMRGKIPADAQDLPDAHAKLSTISSNVLRGQHDPIAEARLLVEVTRTISEKEVMDLLGMRPVEFDSAMALLEPPETPPIVADGQEEPPVNITITLSQDQHLTFQAALQRAIDAMQDEESIVMVQEQAHAYDDAMQRAIKLMKIMRRGDAFARICQWFMHASDEELLALFPPPEKKNGGKKKLPLTTAPLS